jgi:hypothetical protein
MTEWDMSWKFREDLELKKTQASEYIEQTKQCSNGSKQPIQFTMTSEVAGALPCSSEEAIFPLDYTSPVATKNEAISFFKETAALPFACPEAQNAPSVPKLVCGPSYHSVCPSTANSTTNASNQASDSSLRPLMSFICDMDSRASSLTCNSSPIQDGMLSVAPNPSFCIHPPPILPAAATANCINASLDRLVRSYCIAKLN